MRFVRLIKKKRKNWHSIDPDEIFLDSSNLPQFDTHQFEGKIERPISKTALYFVGIIFIVIIFLFTARLTELEIVSGNSFRTIAENNRLKHLPLFAERGIVTDRKGRPLIWNEPFPEEEFSARVYSDRKGLSHILGYVSYPARDSSGFYYKEEFEGEDGIELAYDSILRGVSGLLLLETDAQGNIRSENVTIAAQDGKNLELTVDALLTEALYTEIKTVVDERGFSGGAGVIMDIQNGDILALTSFPEYDSSALAEGDRKKIEIFLNDTRKPFLNRVLSGLYTPGSTIKPVLAIAALSEQIIDPEEQILSTGSISIPNPYIPGEESVFLDWKAHGLVDMRDALAVSSNVYFYEIGGGYKDRKGLGIGKIEAYMRMFGYGQETGSDLGDEETGVIPTPEWKEKIFHDDWRLGDTYNTSIGQYGFQVTPLQEVRAVAAIANGGRLLQPRVVKKIFDNSNAIDGEGIVMPVKEKQLPVDRDYYRIVREGMRRGVQKGTAKGLDVPVVTVAAKTGTAEIGTIKKYAHSWVTGFFPYENPRYAFAVVLERGPRNNLVGALYVMRELLLWMEKNTPEYLN